jgi:hypothetical protein
MIAATNVTIRVDITTFIAFSHSDMLATTKNHLPKIASFLEHDLDANASYSQSLRSMSISAAKTQQQQQTHEYKHTPGSPTSPGQVKTIDKYAMIK